MFKKYDEILELFRGDGDDYWSDVGVIDAIAALNNFNDEDWILLNINKSSRSIEWQCACAETLSDSNDLSKSLYILLDLMNVSDNDLKVAVLDSINSILSSRQITLGDKELYHLKESIKDLKNAKGVVGIMISSLNNKLGAVLD
jgi:hypothetical protein